MMDSRRSRAARKEMSPSGVVVGGGEEGEEEEWEEEVEVEVEEEEGVEVEVGEEG